MFRLSPNELVLSRAISSWLIQREQLKIILGDLGDERNHHVAPGFFARKNCARADSLSRRMRPHKSISHEAFTSAAKTLPIVPVGDGMFPPPTFCPRLALQRNPIAGKIRHALPLPSRAPAQRA
jgi:hypothetical protein